MSTIPFEEGRFYHIFNRGNNKEDIFIEEKNYFFFLQKIKQHLLPTCNIYAYCLMPNHFHLVLQIKELKELPEVYKTGKKKLHQPFSNLFNAYTKSINIAYDRTGSLFQEHLHRNLIESEEYLKDAIIYTLLNPVNHGFTSNYQTYPYSSILSVLSHQPTDIKRNEIKDLFGAIENLIYCLDRRKFLNEEKLKEIEENDI